MHVARCGHIYCNPKVYPCLIWPWYYSIPGHPPCPAQRPVSALALSLQLRDEVSLPQSLTRMEPASVRSAGTAGNLNADSPSQWPRVRGQSQLSREHLSSHERSKAKQQRALRFSPAPRWPQVLRRPSSQSPSVLTSKAVSCTSPLPAHRQCTASLIRRALAARLSVAVCCGRPPVWEYQSCVKAQATAKIVAPSLRLGVLSRECLATLSLAGPGGPWP